MRFATGLFLFICAILAALIAQLVWSIITVFWAKKNPGKALEIAGITLPS